MTPVDDKLKEMYRDFLTEFGIEAVYPAQTLRVHTDAQKLTPGDVESMMQTTFMTQPGADAIYFQGALLDPIKVLDKMEAELNVPIVASNPAMLWFMLSKLGLSYRIAGYGKLLASLARLTADGFSTYKGAALLKKVEKILAPTDLSELSRVGLEYALELARGWGAEVTVYHLANAAELASYKASSMEDLLSKHRQILEQFLNDSFAELLPLVEVRQKVEIGSPGRPVS